MYRYHDVNTMFIIMRISRNQIAFTLGMKEIVVVGRIVLGLFSKSSKPCICTFVHLQPVKVLCISEFLIYENKKFNLNLTYCFPKCAKEIHLFKSFIHWSYKARNLSQKTIGSCYRTSTDFIAFQNPSTF